MPYIVVKEDQLCKNVEDILSSTPSSEKLSKNGKKRELEIIKLGLKRITDNLNFFRLTTVAEELSELILKRSTKHAKNYEAILDKYNTSLPNVGKDVQTANIRAFAFFFRQTTIAYILNQLNYELRKIAIELEFLMRLVDRFPYISSKKICQTKAKLHKSDLPIRNRHAEQITFRSIIKDKYYLDDKLHELFENLNWIYDEFSINGYTLIDKEKAIYYIQRYISILERYRQFTAQHASASIKGRLLEELESIALNVKLFTSAIQRRSTINKPQNSASASILIFIQ